jgi:hypothetical protein
MSRVLNGAARTGGGASVVRGAEGNVVFCDFRGEPGAAPQAAVKLDDLLVGIRAAIVEINGVVNETLAVHAEASALEKEVSELLLKALDSMDIVAFQSRILLAGAGDCRTGDAEFVATTLRRFVSAGVAVGERLQALVGEHRSWIGAEARVLREIVAQAGRLETTASDCIHALRAEARDSDAPR